MAAVKTTQVNDEVKTEVKDEVKTEVKVKVKDVVVPQGCSVPGGICPSILQNR